jgi:hypothetical protein
MLPLAVAAADATLILASDLRREATEATAAGQPLLILYSLVGKAGFNRAIFDKDDFYLTPA